MAERGQKARSRNTPETSQNDIESMIKQAGDAALKSVKSSNADSPPRDLAELVMRRHGVSRE